MSLTGNNAQVVESDATDLALVSLLQNLTLTSNGTIVGSGTVVVNGLTTLDTGNDGTITLNNDNNDFGQITISSTNDQVQLVDVNAIDLAAMNVAALSVKTTGNITDSGAVQVTGNTVLNTGDNAQVTLDHNGNDFNSLSVTSNLDDVTVKDVDDISIAAINAGNITVTSGGNITQTGAFTVSNNAIFNAQGADVLLNTHNNQFNNLSVNANNATINEVDSINLTASSVGNYTLTTDGNITNKGALNITGLMNIDSGNNKQIELNDSGNDFNQLTITSTNDNVIINDINAIDLAGMNVQSLTLSLSLIHI